MIHFGQIDFRMAQWGGCPILDNWAARPLCAIHLAGPHARGSRQICTKRIHAKLHQAAPFNFTPKGSRQIYTKRPQANLHQGDPGKFTPRGSRQICTKRIHANLHQAAPFNFTPNGSRQNYTKRPQAILHQWDPGKYFRDTLSQPSHYTRYRIYLEPSLEHVGKLVPLEVLCRFRLCLSC